MCTILFYTFILGPLIAQADKNIKVTRHLLLLYPDEVIRHIRGLEEVHKDMVRDFVPSDL